MTARATTARRSANHIPACPGSTAPAPDLSDADRFALGWFCGCADHGCDAVEAWLTWVMLTGRRDVPAAARQVSARLAGLHVQTPEQARFLALMDQAGARTRNACAASKT